MSTGQGGAAETVPTADAVGYIRDVLAQAAEPEAVLVQMTAKLVGPLTFAGSGEALRRTLWDDVGRVYVEDRGFRWELFPFAYEHLPKDERNSLVTEGEDATHHDADRALCAALRELGWMVLGVPT